MEVVELSGPQQLYVFWGIFLFIYHNLVLFVLFKITYFFKFFFFFIKKDH